MKRNADSTGDAYAVLLLQAAGKVWTTSLDVADKFGKRHDNVLQAIQSLDCSPEFRLLNFQESEYLNEQGKNQPCVRITRDGFMFLAMGFTGKEAAIWKERYIAAFNAMEQDLRALATNQGAWIQQQFEQHTHIQQLLTVTGSQTRQKVDETVERLDEFEGRVVHLEDFARKHPPKRKEVKECVKALHKDIHHVGGDRCPIDKRLCTTVEIDHFHSNQQADFEHTWPLCPDCHSKLTRGVLKRNDVEASFRGYHEFARRVLAERKHQGELFPDKP